MQLPAALLEAIKDTTGFNSDSFINVHASREQVTSIRVNPLKPVSYFPHFPKEMTAIPWTGYGYYLDERPSFTFDPLFHAGTYYVQEASSMFLEQALRQTADLDKSLKILDLCASPGGKSTHIQSLLSKDSLLVSNDVIRPRANVLKNNIIKWGCENVVVTNNDPVHFSKLENYFDVIVVDAPCSGSGLFRRDPEAIEEWSENNVELCCQRQQRILADVWPALKADGILIYSTCSYSSEEDEDIMDWITESLSSVNCPLLLNEDWHITATISSKGNTGYRFWPDQLKGEGFFMSCFQKKEGGNDGYNRVKNKPGTATTKEMGLIEKWVPQEGRTFIKYENTVYAWPEQLFHPFSFLLQQLRVIYSGVLVGELMRDKLVPDHALALSRITPATLPATELNYEQAIQYLQRKELQMEPVNKGWQLVTYQQQALGWINALPNRINNYYPRELRIFKDN